LTENEVARIVVDAAFKVHTTLGPGLLESVYEKILKYEIEKRGLSVLRQVPLPVVYDGITFDEQYVMDLVVEDLVVIEIKSVQTVLPVHHKQLLTYLRLSGRRLGLLINFGDALIKDGITRIVNRL
jgi:GxxExxY protein